MTDKQNNARELIEYYRGIPGEFYCLKGILVGSCSNGPGGKVLSDNYDTTLIAQRMDEINNSEREQATSLLFP